MPAVESVEQPQDGDDIADNDENSQSPRSSYSSQADSFRSLNSWISFGSENSHIGGPDIEERRDNFWYRKVFANSGGKDAAAVPKKNRISPSGIPRSPKFLSRLGLVIRKSASKRDDGDIDKNSLPKDPTFAETESSLPVIYGEGLRRSQDVPICDRKLFLQKLELCCVVYDFKDTTGKLEAMDVKRKNLQELVQYISSGDAKLDEEEIRESINMVSVNLFRPLPHTRQRRKEAEAYQENQEKLAEMDLDDGRDPSESVSEPDWSHIQLVYDFLLQVVKSSRTDADLAKTYIDSSFLLRFVNLFDSQDPTEREYVKTIFHRIYDKFMVHRPFLRRTMNIVFCEFMNGNARHNGISELLDVLGNIINRFDLPLKDEHKLTLFRVLLPLHKPRTLGMYSEALTHCVTQFVKKDPTLAAPVISGLLKNWPRADWSREVLLLGELEQVLGSIHTGHTDLKICMWLFSRRMARCMQSPHQKVAERALLMWKNKHAVNLIINYQSLYDVYAAARKNKYNHWNQDVVDLSVKAMEMLVDIDHGTLPVARKSSKWKRSA